MDQIHAECSVIRGAGRPGATTMAGLDAATGVVLLVGHHASAGAFPGIMAHRISYGMFKKVWLNDKVIGEAAFFAIRAGELGVPIGMVSGDQIVAEQVLAICPDAQAVIVKQALGNQSARCLPPIPARALIREGAKVAVERAAAGALKPFTDAAPPYDFTVELRKPAPAHMRDNLASLDHFELIEPDVVRVTAADMFIGFRRVAYLGYANTAGVTRH